eukprot:6838364-Alexandrium_andersonii.AAC.1
MPPQQPAEEAPATPSTAASPGPGAAPAAPTPLTADSTTGSLSLSHSDGLPSSSLPATLEVPVPTEDTTSEKSDAANRPGPSF